MERITESQSGHARVPGWWEALLAESSRRSIFLSAAWIETWLETYGAGFECEWVRWEAQGRVVAGVLAVAGRRRVKGLPIRAVYTNATGEARERTPLAEYNDVLCAPGWEAAAASALAGYLDARRWDCAYVSGYGDGSVLEAFVAAQPAPLVFVEERHAPYVDLADVPQAGFESTLTGKVGNHIRRNRRLYEVRDGAYAIVPAGSLDAALGDFREMARLHNLRWQARGIRGSFESPAVVAFHEKLISRLWDAGQVDLLCARSGEAVAGYLYNFRVDGRVCVFQTGFRYEDDSKLSPGILTHALAIEHYRRLGCTEYDFLAGDALYKRSLSNRTRRLRWTRVFRDRPWIRLLLLAREWKARLAG